MRQALQIASLITFILGIAELLLHSSSFRPSTLAPLGIFGTRVNNYRLASAMGFAEDISSISYLNSPTIAPFRNIPRNARPHKFWPKIIRIPPARNITVRKTGQNVSIVSAVPVFGDDESYIALLTENGHEKFDALWRPTRLQRKKWKALSKEVAFCSGPKRSHVSPLRYNGSVLICPWPSEERYKTFFDVHLEDSEERALGSFVASHDPISLGQYRIMACVRDFFEPDGLDERKRSGVFSQLVQWMEWYLMHGVEHFLVYKFNVTDSIEEDILRPYLDAGLATMVYFDSCPNHPRWRHGHSFNDCLFRAKKHAEWLMPAVDVDEYIYLPGGLAHGLKEHVFGNLNQVHSLEFKRIRFAKSARNQLDISAKKYEAMTGTGARGLQNPKQFVHVDSVYRVSTHGTELHDHDKSAIEIDLNVSAIHHYRFPYHHKILQNGQYIDNAHQIDESLSKDVAALTEALMRRFGLQNSREVQELLQKLAVTRASNCHPR